VQSGKPVGVFRTHADAPRVLIANSNLVPHWATWDHFNELDKQGPDDVRPDDRRLVDLHRHAGHRAGHLRDLRARRAASIIGGDLKGKWILTGGLGGMGGAQPLAATMAGASLLAVECQPDAHRFAPAHPLSRRQAKTLDEALAIIERREEGRARRSRSACSAMPPKSSPNW
jgi:urocanate hydratase